MFDGFEDGPHLSRRRPPFPPARWVIMGGIGIAGLVLALILAAVRGCQPDRKSFPVSEWRGGDMWIAWMLSDADEAEIRKTPICEIRLTDIHGNVFRQVLTQAPVFRSPYEHRAAVLAFVFAPVDSTWQAEARRWKRTVSEPNQLGGYWPEQKKWLDALGWQFLVCPLTLTDKSGRIFRPGIDQPQSAEVRFAKGKRLNWRNDETAGI